MNKTHAMALRHARRYINTSRAQFICHALSHVKDDYPSYRRVVFELKCYIDRQLNGYFTLDSWIKINHPEKMRNSKGRRVKYPTASYRAYMKATRLAWIDHMIAEFEAIDNSKKV